MATRIGKYKLSKEQIATSLVDGGHAEGPVVFNSDTNLYRSAANTLKTDDSLHIAGNAAIDGAVIISDSTTALDIGHTPTLQVYGNDAHESALVVGRFSSDTSTPSINLLKSNTDTVGGNTLVAANSYLGYIAFRGANGSNFSSQGGAIGLKIDGTPSSTSFPGVLTLYTTKANAVSPTLTTQGDILYHNGSAEARLAAGTAGYYLKTNGSGQNPSWGEVQTTVADGCIYLNNQTISSNYTMPSGKNGMSAGPITISGSVTIPNGGSWSIV